MARIVGADQAPEFYPDDQEHRAQIARRANDALSKTGSEAMETPLGLVHYATANLPPAADYEGFIVYDSTTQTVKWSNGTVWATI